MRAIISTYARKVPCFLFSPIKCAVSSGFPQKIFSHTGFLTVRRVFTIRIHSEAYYCSLCGQNTLYNAQDTYLCSLSLHTVENCAKITCIGLYNCGLFFIFIFLYKEVFRYESFE